MFGRKKVEEVPLYYWEEKSYMMVIAPDGSEEILKNALNRLMESKEVKILKNNYSIEKNVVELKIEYDQKDYEIGLFVGGVSVPDYYIKSYLFTDKDREKINRASEALTIYMKFKGNIKKCFQLQLKLAYIMMPEAVGVLDESAEKMIPIKLVKMIARSKVLPSAKHLFSVQAVQDDHRSVWLHTHGLCRCGITELEILNSDSSNQQNHYNVLNTYAVFLIDKNGKYSTEDGAFIGSLVNGSPVVVTAVGWTQGLSLYKHLAMGGLKDRKTGHNSKTSIVFLYTSEENERNGKVDKISIYNDLWGDNPIFFFSDEETKRMKEAAIDTFDYVKKGFKDKDNEVLLKIGLPLEEEGKYEHIWFALLEIKGNKFKARLTQEPYYFKDIHTGYEAWYDVSDITDWVIYTKEYSVNSDTAFLLDKD